MWSDVGTETFLISEPFAEALRAVRAALAAGGLRTLAEFDVAARLRKTLRINVPPCRILYVWPATSDSETFPTAAVFLPLHLVIASQGHETELCALSEIQPEAKDLDAFVKAAVTRTHRDMLQCLDRISMRASLVSAGRT